MFNNCFKKLCNNNFLTNCWKPWSIFKNLNAGTPTPLERGEHGTISLQGYYLERLHHPKLFLIIFFSNHRCLTLESIWWRKRMHEMGENLTPSLEKTSKMQKIKKCERKSRRFLEHGRWISTIMFNLCLCKKKEKVR